MSRRFRAPGERDPAPQSHKPSAPDLLEITAEMPIPRRSRGGGSDGGDSWLARHSRAVAALIVIAGIATAAWVGNTILVGPARNFNPRADTLTVERNGLSDSLPAVKYEQYVDRAHRVRYYESGDGFLLRLITRNDPRKQYADSVAVCGIPRETNVNFQQRPRRMLADSLEVSVKRCVDAFLAPIGRTVPVNIMVDVTEGTGAVEATVRKLLFEGDLAEKLLSPKDTFVVQASLIYDAPSLASRVWRVRPGTDVEQVLEEMSEWLLRPQGPKRSSSVSLGLLNSLEFRRIDRDLRGGYVYVVSDGMELSRNRRAPDALNFYEARRGRDYLTESNWEKFDQKILKDYGEPCTPLYGATVHWFAPPSTDLVSRRASEYWEHFLRQQCGAGGFWFRP